MCSGCGTPSSRSARASVCTHLARRDLPVHVRSSTSSLRWLNLKAEMPAGLTTFTPIALRRVDRPADVVADALEDPLPSASMLQEQLVVAEHHVGAVVEDRHVAHLHVRVARVASRIIAGSKAAV